MIRALVQRLRGKDRDPGIPPAAAVDYSVIQSNARAAARIVRLPFRTGGRLSGNLQARESGSSLEFKDHRPYLPGDDPRQIDWRAYARTESYILKVYHQESSPAVDVLADLSPSMRLFPDKYHRALELCQLCVLSAMGAGAVPRIHIWSGRDISTVTAAAFLDKEPEPSAGLPARTDPPLDRVPWAAGSIRVCVSDLLYPLQDPARLRPLTARRGRALILAPFSREESNPDWSGQAEFLDCESDARRFQRVSEETLRRYRASYATHFELWKGGAIRYGVGMARVPSHPPLLQAIRDEALPAGVLEPIN